MTTPITWGLELILNTPNLTTDSSQVIARFSDGGFVAVWASTNFAEDGNSAIVGRLFNADGTPKGAEFLINSTTAGTQQFPQVTMLNDDRFVVTWEDGSNTGAETGLGIRARMFNQDGSYYDRNGDGVNDDLDFVVNTTTAGAQQKPSITALSNGGFTIAYQTDAGTDQDVRSQTYDAAGNAVGGEVAINTKTTFPQRAPVVAGLSGDRYIALWVDFGPSDDQGAVATVRGRIMTAGTADGGVEFLVPSSRGSKEHITVTELTNGRFVVAWSHYPDFATGNGGDGSGSSVKAQIFNADGTPYRGEFVVNGPVENDQRMPSIVALPDGGFAIAYIDVSIGRSLVRLASFDSEGGRSISDIAIGPPVGSTVSTRPNLTVLLDGRIVVTWSENSLSRLDDAASIRGQIIDPRTEAVNFAGTSKNDDYHGTDYYDFLDGADGNDLLSGGWGNDTLMGGQGADMLRGGRDGFSAAMDGFDFASYANASAGVAASLLTSSGSAGEANGDTYISIEGLIGSAHADQLAGDDNANNLFGRTGDDLLAGNDGIDLLVGEEGNDTLDGGKGADRLDGGAGDDTYVVDDAADAVIELAGGGYDTIETSVSYSIAALQVEALTAIGTGAIRLTGNARNNVITGNAAVNVIKGGAGADTMAGGNGNDVYYVGSRTDKVIEVAAGGTADRVVTTVSYALSANVEQLIATGKGWVDLTGNKLNNLITGNVSKNIINGGAGNDKINGGYGNDVLAGGTGKDIFIFKDKLNSRSNMDRIADFSVRDDTIQLDNAIFTKLGAGTPTAPRLLSEDYFIVGKAANDENDYIIYDNETGILYYDADGSGAGAAIAFAKIAVDLPLSRADFLVI